MHVTHLYDERKIESKKQDVLFQFSTISSEFILIFIGSVLIQRQKAISDLFIFKLMLLLIN